MELVVIIMRGEKKGRVVVRGIMGCVVAGLLEAAGGAFESLGDASQGVFGALVGVLGVHQNLHLIHHPPRHSEAYHALQLQAWTVPDGGGGCDSCGSGCGCSGCGGCGGC